MRLVDFLMASEPTERSMSLLHCTSVSVGLQVMADRQLDTKRCKVYKDDLLYLFYGRPAYKAGEGVPASAIIEQAPICLVFNPSVLAAAVRMLPFDSGGFARYRSLVGTNLGREDFELPGDADIPRRLVGAFYETNRNYYYQQSTLQEKSVALSRQSARALARLIADPSIKDDDDRCGTIEVQLASSIRLADALQAIVGPPAFIDDPQVQEVLDACPEVLPMTYPVYGRMGPAGFANSIYERVETFLIKEGAL